MAILNKDWWKNAVVYQIYPRSFCDSNDDGIGDIPGIISKLHYLKELGIDVIWLSPIFPSPNNNNGYDISDFKNVNSDFGTLEDMDRLIAKAKRIGIKIILDISLNATSDEHEWFKKALSGDLKYKNYYHIVDSKKKPNNWTTFWGRKAWEPISSDSFYLHLFHKKEPELNWQNPDVFDEFCDIFRFWLDRGIAGFRISNVNLLYKKSFENGKNHLSLTGREHYLDSEGCHDIIHRLRQEVFSKYKCFIVGETVYESSEAAKLFCAPDREELDLVFPFEHIDISSNGFRWLKKKYSPRKFLMYLDKWQHSLFWTANYFESHDHVRSVNYIGNVSNYWLESAKLIGGLNLTLRGTPFIFEGQELGMTNGDFSRIRELRDFESHDFDYQMKKFKMPRNLRRSIIISSSKDNARTPMQWDSSEYAGFSSVAPWIKLNKNKSSINVESESADENSILNFYKKIIEIRKSIDSLSGGSYRRIASAGDVYIFTREAEADRVYVYANMTPYNRVVEFYGDTIIIDNYSEDMLDMSYLLPFEFRVVKTRV